MTIIEALYIFDEHNTLLFDHTYIGASLYPATLLPLYLQHPTPRPSLIHLTSCKPPVLLHSIVQDNLLFLAPCSTDTDPLHVLEFLRRVADAFEEFLGSPLLASKITANYDVVSQIVAEIADGGIACHSEPNALRDIVDTGPGALQNLLGSIGASGSGPALQSNVGGVASLQSSLSKQSQTAQGSAVPWRRSNVKHTSNELYVDLVESISAIIAPSGRPISAFAYGSIAFTSKVSGVPDLLLLLSPPGGGTGSSSAKGDRLRNMMERVVFHPCVRLNRWKQDGCLSFVPPDGRFALCGYEVDLLGSGASLSASATAAQLELPVSIEFDTSLGTSGLEFEVRAFPTTSRAASSAQASLSSHLSARSKASTASSDAAARPLEDITVHIPLPSTTVRNVPELRSSKGEAHYSPTESRVEWKISGKDFGALGATLRCAVQPVIEEGEGVDVGGATNGSVSNMFDYDEDYQSPRSQFQRTWNGEEDGLEAGGQKARRSDSALVMPSSATLSFSAKGWLASGIKVESLNLDAGKSRGLRADVKPYKGVKYLTVSREGVELRC